MGQARTAIRSAGAVIGGVLLIVVTAVAAHADSHRWLKVSDIPASETSACAAYARAQARHRTSSEPWICIGDQLTRTNRRGTRSVKTVLPSGKVARAARTTSPIVEPFNVIDSYHAKKTVSIGWSTGNASGWTSYSYYISIYNHSADVKMSYFETTGKSILMNWRLRIRHDISLGFDTTVFTYPDVMGPATYRQNYSETEGRYGDGYNKLPYEKSWKVFWDSYNVSIRYGGVNVYADNTAQSDRAICYKTVSCKFPT